MKHYFFLVCMAFNFKAAVAQDISGAWQGLLQVQGMQLKVVFHLKLEDSTYHGTMDSPDQNAFGVPVTHVTFSDSLLKLQVANLGISYQGKLNRQNKIEGTFTQAGSQFPLMLSTEPPQKHVVIRPQEPLQPYPYHSQKIIYEIRDGTITFGATLTTPDSGDIYPAVILISGSGPQDRNEEIMGHKPFLVLADHLTRQGVAVLRYDDRGTGESTGNFQIATSEDFTDDAEAALEYLKSRNDIDPTRIGIIGHSEGGLVAAMLAARRPEIDFIVLLASPGIPGDQLLLEQIESVGLSMGKDPAEISAQQEITKGMHELIRKFQHNDSLSVILANYLYQAIENSQMEIPDGVTVEDLVRLQVTMAASPWYKYYLQHHPGDSYRKLSCPVLALNGGKDVQVSANNLDKIEESIKSGDNENITTKEYPQLNHLFQEGKTGAVSEYALIDQTISPEVLKDISDWIKEVVGLE